MADIGIHARRRLLIRCGNTCAFPGCDEPLLVPTPDGSEDTNVGIECHIVAKKDVPTVARAPCLLSDEERKEFAHLIADRHGFANLVMMCLAHAKLIDDPNQGHSVAEVLEMKRAHEDSNDQRRPDLDQARRDDQALVYSEIVDEWQRRFGIDRWQQRVGALVGDGHPRMREEDFEALTAARAWLFERVWPGSVPELEGAMENFRVVCQDLQAVLSQHRHEVLGRDGIVAIARFYNDRRYWGAGDGPPDHRALDAKYEFYSRLVEDLTFELTRAANLVCELVREHLDSRYRIDEGVVTIESGPYMDFSTRTHRPHYGAEAGSSPYEGLRDFLTTRSEREETRGEGDAPEGVRLPGDDPFRE